MSSGRWGIRGSSPGSATGRRRRVHSVFLRPTKVFGPRRWSAFAFVSSYRSPVLTATPGFQTTYWGDYYVNNERDSSETSLAPWVLEYAYSRQRRLDDIAREAEK
eukprot:scaffold553_cov238-Pinguiococcus_pyrenoidosus.AAC.8